MNAPIAPSSKYDFRGHPVRRLSYREAFGFIGREVGSALEYADGGKQFVRDLTTAWSGEIREGVHWFRVKGDELRQLKASLALAADPASGGDTALIYASELIILTEEGLNLALMRSGQPHAVELWKCLAVDVVSQHARTETSAPTPAPALPTAAPSERLAAVLALVRDAVMAGNYDVAIDVLNLARRLEGPPIPRSPSAWSPGAPIADVPRHLLPSAKLVRALRAELGVSQSRLAEMGGLQRIDVANLEGGRNKATSDHIRDGLAVAFKLTREELARALAGELSPEDAMALAHGRPEPSTAARKGKATR